MKIFLFIEAIFLFFAGLEAAWGEPKVCWSAEAELLIFQPSLENLYYGDLYRFNDLTITEAAIPDAYNIYSGSASQEKKRMTFRYYPGVRAKLTGTLIDYGLDAGLSWTHFHSTSNQCAQGLIGNPYTGSYFQASPGIFSYGIPIGITGALNSAPVATFGRAQYSIFFTQADFLLSKKLCLFQNIIIEPSIGLTAIKIKQKFKTSYFAKPDPETIPSLITENRIEQDAIRFEGIGSKAGFTSYWAIYPSVNIFGGLFGALYYGKFDVKQFIIEQAFDGPFFASNIVLNEHTRFEDLRFAGTMNLGIEYLFFVNFSEIRLAASWEANWYPAQNMLAALEALGNVNNVPSNPLSTTLNNTNKPNPIGGDLSLTGFVLSAEVWF